MIDAVGDGPSWYVGQLAKNTQIFSPSTRCSAIVEHLINHPLLPGVVLGDSEQIVGLAGRHHLLRIFANPGHGALYERRPVSELADTAPLIVDAALDVDLVMQEVSTSKPSALQDGFVIMDGTHYLGLGVAPDLIYLATRKAQWKLEEIDQARGAAVAASAAKSAFLASMSHELRTPLNAILGFSEVISLQALGPVGSPRYLEYARDIHASGEYLLATINDILDLAKIEAGKMEITPEPVGTSDIIDACRRMIAVKAQQKTLRIQWPDHRASTLLYADKTAAIHALLNILSNAVKFTPDGGTISVSVQVDEGGGVTFTVSDTGPGMAASQIERMFAPFERANNTYVATGCGTGLGLSIVRSLMALHGGHAKLESELGVGTHAHLWFPPNPTAERGAEPTASVA